MLNCRVGQTGFLKNPLMISLPTPIVKSMEKTYPLVKLTSPLSLTIYTTYKHKKTMLDVKLTKVGRKYICEYLLQGSFSLSVEMKLIKRMGPISSDKFRMYLNIFRKQNKCDDWVLPFHLYPPTSYIPNLHLLCNHWIPRGSFYFDPLS